MTVRDGAALVIGGSGAIGSAVAQALAADGHDVVLTYRSNAAAADAAAAAVRATGRRGATHRVAMDVDAEVSGLVEEVVAAFGGITTLVTAAAPVASQQWTGRIPPARFGEQMNQDVTAVHRIITAAIPALRASRGSIIAITTVANRRYVLRDVLSSAPKAAVEALIKAVAAEEGKSGVRANAVGVGILADGMSATLIERGEVTQVDMDHARGQIPLGRLGQASDIGGVVAFLASPRASYITGQWLDVDGGYSI